MVVPDVLKEESKERVPDILFYPALFFKHYFVARGNKRQDEGGRRKD
jgi:hypothetical protein